MKITNSTIQQYTLPLSRPLTIGKTRITTRQGIVLTLQSDIGLQGYGEISPLPGLHKETLPEATEQLLKHRCCLSQISISQDMLSFDGQLSQALPAELFPSVRSGIEMAILDLLLQMYPCNLPKSIPINALLIADNKTLTEQVDDLLLKGFSSIKIKVARQPIEKDIEDITDVLAKIQSKALIRLDANRKWTLAQAKQFCNAIDPQDIEYIEEPTRNPIDHISLSKSTGIPIALDETLTDTAFEKLNENCCGAVILKPSLLGGFERTAQIIRQAKQYNIIPVISSAFQTSLANRMYLLFAALNQITQTPLGLDTAKWFKDDLLSAPLVIENGKISLDSLSTPVKLREDSLKPLEEKC